jgi:predicted metal-dependent hydrolase
MAFLICLWQVSSIQVRDLAFDFDRGAGGLWNPERPELSHIFNAFQLALPFLEPYFIDAVKEAASILGDSPVRDAALAFCAQEANHSRQHKRYNRSLKARYPRIEEYEKSIQQSLVRSRGKDSLEWRLAYTAGYEAITAQLCRWMFHNADELFRGADGHFSALMLWHGAEEIEHRHVAYDVLRAVTRNYGLRARGLFAAIRKTEVDIRSVVGYMLEVDGLASDRRSRARRRKLRSRLVLALLPAVVRYLSPGYHPSRDPEPEQAIRWLEAYRDGIDLRSIDTTAPILAS